MSWGWMMIRVMGWIGLAGCKGLEFRNGLGSWNSKWIGGSEFGTAWGVNSLGGFGVSWVSILGGG